MGLFLAVRSELIKMKHSAYMPIHVIMPHLGAILFTVYYWIYRNADTYEKLNLILEITATIIPLLISVVVGINIVTEEKNCNFLTMLAVSKRGRLLMAKLFVLYGAGVAALTVLFILFMFGAGFWD